MKLQGKTAVITGAGPGLGRTLAVLLAREGADGDTTAMALRRIATEDDVAQAVLHLASDAARSTTGATIDVNAGQLFT